MSDLDGFARQLPESKGNATAGAASVAIHFAAGAALWLLLLLSQPGLTRPKLPVPGLHVSLRLPEDLLRKPMGNAAAGGGGERSLTLPSRGNAPPASPVKSFVAPLPLTSVTPKLVVQPTLLDAQAPKIDVNQYGDPTSQIAGLAFGMGVSGIGTGGIGGLGDKSGNGDASGGTGHVYGVGEGVSLPTVLFKIEPEYSEQARQAKFSGSLLLRVVVDEAGPRSIKVIRPLGLGLDEKAVEAVQQWRFRPGRKNGRAVAVEATIELSFRLL